MEQPSTLKSSHDEDKSLDDRFKNYMQKAFCWSDAAFERGDDGFFCSSETATAFQVWKLTADRFLTVTTTEAGEAVLVSWQDEDHRILEVVWQKPDKKQADKLLPWRSTREGLLAYVMQDDMNNRLTPRIVDIAYTAFMSRATGKNKDDGGPCDWFNDTKPQITKAIEQLKSDLLDAPSSEAHELAALRTLFCSLSGILPASAYSRFQQTGKWLPKHAQDQGIAKLEVRVDDLNMVYAAIDHVNATADFPLTASNAKSDSEHYTDTLSRAKSLVTDVYAIASPEVKKLIELRTGPWLVWGADRDWPRPCAADSAFPTGNVNTEGRV